MISILTGKDYLLISLLVYHQFREARSFITTAKSNIINVQKKRCPIKNIVRFFLGSSLPLKALQL